MMKGMPREFGFNKVSLASDGAFMKNRTEVQCYGTMILDEMKVREVVAFNKSTYKVDGFVDYGHGHDSETIANPRFGSHVCAIASLLGSANCKFRNKTRSPWKSVARLVLEAILKLWKHNAVVVSCNQ
ncbi:hypothetical protein HPB49_018358 [Dermacentor silvarum]|uniref:Uncharacterized protein n=1 Tax=Dermacentor silvarum TaxID=543639 RepID=A0ACB8DQI0_DERSI|nr:hypothetical protein HPB49_018358 [Dermacentor silvarum]